MDPNLPQCQALRLSDGQRCENEATHANNLFCGFHSKQVYGLYKGYKRRNARLDALDEEAPSYLRNAKGPLANDKFETLQDENALREVHSHLFEKFVLLGKVIAARKLHHKHFYSLHVDYGHQAYLDRLSSQRYTVLQALERLERRTAEVLYQKEKWFTWVRGVQEEEEALQEKEQKKVKQEAALFKRHMNKLESRLSLIRQKEEQKRQDEYLEDVYRERMSSSADESEDDGKWDPIDDVEHDNRNRYIDLIKHFLWFDLVDNDEGTSSTKNSEANCEETGPASEPQVSSKKAKKKRKAKDSSKSGTSGIAEATSRDQRGQNKLLAMQGRRKADTGPAPEEPGKHNIETEQEMRKRLSHGVKKNYEKVWGPLLVGTLENPLETHDRTAPMTDDEIESTLNDVKDIKLLLFCRLLLAQTSLLPAAIRAASVHEFFQDADITNSDLRDLCLRVEDPTLQEIRDACADFARGDEADDDEEDLTEDEDYEDETFEELLGGNRKYRHLHTDDWFIHNIAKQANLVEKNMPKSRRTKVTICGKTIWNHASEKAMSRDGWLQFSVLAKDCNLEHVIELCRNWAEFSDLNLLTRWQYFPASNWVSWGNNKIIQQLQDLGFFPYFIDLEAQQHSRYFQVGGRSQGRRQHDIVETRNVIFGHMKRNDPITRRFLQYLVMRTGELLVMVRDGKTGRVITAPPDEHLWTYRKKQGLGRATKNEWQNLLEIGPEYFYMTDLLREWRFGFDDYYDVVIWDFVPGQSSMDMYNVVISELRTAWRISHPRDVYTHMGPLLRTLTREKDTQRTRQIRPGEDVESIWDIVTDERNQFVLYNVTGTSVTSNSDSDLAASPYMFYNKAQAVEDEVLFPDELDSTKKSVPFREIRNGVNRVVNGALPSAVRHLAKGTEALNRGEDPIAAANAVRDDDEDSIWALPKLWATGLEQVYQKKLSREQRELLKRTGLDFKRKGVSLDQRLHTADPTEIMEYDRSFGFKESFHAGDLEPGCTQSYLKTQEKIAAMLKTPSSGSTDWIWLLAEIIDWLQLRVDSDDYAQDPFAPWPHSFIVQDMVQAFVAMSMFFPELAVVNPMTMFLKSKACAEFRESLLFDPIGRSKLRPDRRSRTSYKFRNAEFWAEWNKFIQTPNYYADVYPMDWSLAIRPIVAQLYRAGIIAPAYLQNDLQIVSGMATANTEDHRPGKLDLFINYEDPSGNFPTEFPPFFVGPDEWTKLLPHAVNFARAHDNPRFALLKVWSAPHFYPLMVGLQNRQGISFLDSAGRSWEWHFVPKDMPGSEFSMHHAIGRRLELLQQQFEGHVVHRGDLVLVMSKDTKDLLRFCIAVTFAIQTKPWLREIDLWKSFINVDLDFLQNLESFWLD